MTRVETVGSQREPLDAARLLKPSRTNSSAPALVPQKGGGFRWRAGDPGLEGAGQGSGCPEGGGELTSQGPATHRPVSPLAAHLRSPTLRAAVSAGKCQFPHSRKLLGHRPLAAPATLLPTPAVPSLGGARQSAPSRLPGCLATAPQLNPYTRVPKVSVNP